MEYFELGRKKTYTIKIPKNKMESWSTMISNYSLLKSVHNDQQHLTLVCEISTKSQNNTV